MKGLRTRAPLLIAAWIVMQATTCPVAKGATSFRAVDVLIDAGPAPLAAWQVEVRLATGSLLVGVEGGVKPFSEPAYHDPRALQSGRIVIAAFSTLPDEALPKGRVRVARLHLRVGEELDPLATVQAAATPDGRRLKARVFLVPVEN